MNRDTMKLRTPTADELRLVYERDLSEAFPPQELKPLRNIVQMTQRGKYAPLCLYDGAEIVGECFLWLGRPGWMLLDYLCVTRTRRNTGLGAYMLQALLGLYPDSVIIGEVEAVEHAPVPEMASRRIGFYLRNGARLAGVDTELFGVHYKTLYYSRTPRPDAEIWREHAAIYKTSFPPDEYERYERYIQIPRRTTGAPSPLSLEALETLRENLP